MKCLEMMYFMLKLVIYLFDNTGDMIVRSYKIRARDNSNYSGFGNVVSKGGSCKLNFANNK
jgi:hypothetical protein